MSSDASTNLQLPYLMPAQAQKHVTVNESLRRLDALVQCAVESRSVSVQPAAPADASVYIAPPGKTGAAWDDFTNHALAYYRDGAWVQLHPREGWRVWVRDEGRALVYRNAAWSVEQEVTSRPNLLLNGGFDVWQRGTSFGIPVSYFTFVADRWQAFRGGAAAGMTVTRQAGEAGGVAAKMQRDASNADTSPLYLAQTLPSAWCQGLAGAALSVSVRVRAGANYSGGNFKATVFTGTGTDQNSISGLSGSVSNGVIDAALTTSNQTLTGTFTVPAGVTQIAIWLEWTPSGTAGADDSVTVEFVKVERGATATPYVAPEPVAELARCQSFYRTWGGGSAYDTALAGFANSTSVAYFAHSPAPKMRATPTLSVAGSWELIGMGGATAVSTIAAQYLDATTSVINAQTTGLTAGAGYYLRAANDTSARIILSAEI